MGLMACENQGLFLGFRAFQLATDRFSGCFGEESGAFAGEVDVSGFLAVEIHLASHDGVEVIDFDVVFFHDADGRLVVDEIIAHFPPCFSFWHRGVGCEDQSGAGFLKAGHDGIEIGGVFFRRMGQGALDLVAVPLIF